MSLCELLQKAIIEGVTDIHLEENQYPYFRLGNSLVRYTENKVSAALFTEILIASELGILRESTGDNNQQNMIIPSKENIALEKVADSRKLYETFSKDGAFSFQNIRVRVHLYCANQQRCGTLRILYNDSLNMPEGEFGKLLHRIVNLQEGLVLVTGPTGYGVLVEIILCTIYRGNKYDKIKESGHYMMAALLFKNDFF